MRAANQRTRLPLHTQYNKNDRCRLSRLSKIAHICRSGLRPCAATGPKYVGISNAVRRRGIIALHSTAEIPSRRTKLKFPATFEADLIRPTLDRERTLARARAIAQSAAP